MDRLTHRGHPSMTLDRVYEALKLKWQQEHLDATSEQYEAYIKELADTLGI